MLCGRVVLGDQHLEDGLKSAIHLCSKASDFVIVRDVACMKRFSHYPKKERLHPRRNTWPVVVLNGCIVAIMLGAGSVVLAGLNVSNSKADIVATRPASRASSETPKALITVAANPQSGREKEPVTATPPAPAAPSQAPLLPTTPNCEGGDCHHIRGGIPAHIGSRNGGESTV